MLPVASPRRLIRALVLVATLHGLAEARMSDVCPSLFAGGRLPVIVDPKFARETAPLCYESFAVLYSGVSRTPVYAAEHLTRESVSAARRVDRAEFFHEEERLPVASRAWLSDYVRSGYDRGHMAPAADMPTPTAQDESFSLANIVPQDRSSNRFLWSAIEESVRRLAMRRGELFVVTGPIFTGSAVSAIGGGVVVPTQFFKAVYDPARDEAAAYLVANDSSEDWHVIPIARLQIIAGLDPFPRLPPGARTTAMVLPEPYDPILHPRGGQREESWGAWLGDQLYSFLARIWTELMRAIF